MPDIELGPVRPLGAIDVRIARQAAGNDNRPARTGKEAPAVVKSEALDPGEPPVDTERVELIREAIASGNYPVTPTKIADAMIAGGTLLRNGQ